MTADELEQMPDGDSVLIELDEGELITMPLAGADHGYRGIEITMILGNYVKNHKLGRVYAADTGFRLRDDTVRAPDVAFVRAERVSELHGPGLHGKAFANGAPDLAVEIFSPSDSVPQLMRKVKQYLAAGCHTVWVVYPERQEIHVFEGSGVDRLLHAGDTMEAPELLPGFCVPVSDFFE
jgi:Uma2 family endonuclease